MTSGVTPFRRAARRAIGLGAAFGALLAGACSDSSTGPKGSGANGVSITPKEVRLEVGGTATLSATVRDARGNEVRGAQIFWSSADTALAVVSAEGVVQAKKAGTVKVAASVAGQSDIATVIISPPAVVALSLSPTTGRITVGASLQLTAAALGANGQPLGGRTIAWRSSDETVATVDASGRVTGIGPGAVSITATSEGRSAAAAITVVPVAIGSVTLAPASAELTVGQTTQLDAVVNDVDGVRVRDRDVRWSSSDQAVATVSSTGLVVALAPGSATISASVEGKSATAAISVSAVPVGAVVVSPSPAQITVGQTITLSVQITDASGRAVSRPVSFVSDDPGVATVSSTGDVTGVTVGTTTVRATSDGTTGSTSVVVGLVPVASVSVTPGSAELMVGGTTTLTAAARDAAGRPLDGRPMTWTSSNSLVATVSGSGVVTALSPGAVVIFATSEGMSDRATITVRPVPVASVAVTPPGSSITVGQTTQLSASVRDAGGNVLTDRAVTWSSSDDRVALVSGTGLVSGVNPGTATITATSEGRAGTATVTVSAPAPAPVASVSVTPPRPTVKKGDSVTLTAVCSDASGNALSDRVISWTSSASGSIATLSATSGPTTTVRGKREGSTTVTASCEGKTGSSLVTIVEE